jgi:hypothetical protein
VGLLTLTFSTVVLVASLRDGEELPVSNVRPGAPASTASEYGLRPPDIVSLARHAVQGDAASSHKLWMHYEYVEVDLPEAEFWGRLAAEQGDCAAQRALLGTLRRRERPAQLESWTRRVREDGCAVLNLPPKEQAGKADGG